MLPVQLQTLQAATGTQAASPVRPRLAKLWTKILSLCLFAYFVRLSAYTGFSGRRRAAGPRWRSSCFVKVFMGDPFRRLAYRACFPHVLVRYPWMKVPAHQCQAVPSIRATVGFFNSAPASSGWKQRFRELAGNFQRVETISIGAPGGHFLYSVNAYYCEQVLPLSMCAPSRAGPSTATSTC